MSKGCRTYTRGNCFLYSSEWTISGGGLPISGFMKRGVYIFFSSKTQRFASFILDGVMGPWCHTWQCPCFSGSNTWCESRGLEGHHVSSKSPSRILDAEGGVAGRNGRDRRFPDGGSLICPPDKSMIFYLSGPPNTWLLATPGPPGIAPIHSARWIGVYLMTKCQLRARMVALRWLQDSSSKASPPMICV